MIMIKKSISVLLLLCLICMLAIGCGGKQITSTDGVDVDLTRLSGTMVYAEVNNMMTSAEKYMDKTIRISGPYYASYLDETDEYYHYVIIEDATACCKQGIEFIWNGEHEYPGDYPEENARIEVTGVFQSHEVLGKTYYYLAVDEITVLD